MVSRDISCFVVHLRVDVEALVLVLPYHTLLLGLSRGIYVSAHTVKTLH